MFAYIGSVRYLTTPYAFRWIFVLFVLHQNLQPVSSFSPSFSTKYCNWLYCDLPNSQVNRLAHIENSLAGPVVKALRSSCRTCHVTPVLSSGSKLTNILIKTYFLLHTQLLWTVNLHNSSYLSSPTSSQYLLSYVASFIGLQPVSLWKSRISHFSYLWNQHPYSLYHVLLINLFHLILLILVYLLHQHFHHSSLIAYSTLGWKSIFSTNISHRRLLTLHQSD